MKETVPCLGRSLGPFCDLCDAAPALQQVRDLWRLGAAHTEGWRVTAASVFIPPLLLSLSSARVRAGTVYSIKMLLEQECAYVNYTKEEDCDRAIQCFNVRTREPQASHD